jgi:hypothetical protein
MALQTLSDFLQVSDTELSKYGVMNAIISVDNHFFIEPRLLFHTKLPFFLDAAPKIEAHFQRVIALIAASKKTGDIAWIAAHKLLQFEEPQGFALGYGVHRPNGRGVGPALAKDLMDRARTILKMGVEDPMLFEVLELFGDGFGPDLISDTQASILEENFLAYSQDVANRLKLKKRSTRVIKGRSYEIPRGPDGRGLVLVPEEFLTPLPIEVPWESMEYAAALDESVRKQLSELFTLAAKKPKKSEIANVLLKKKDVIDRLLKSFRESVGTKYDFESDPMGVISWLRISLETVVANPETISLESQTPNGLVGVIRKLIGKFKQNVEENGLWKEFYREPGGRAKHERFGQLLFYAISDAYCDANNLDLSRESNGGNGPVDFKLSKGANFKYLVEMKLSSNPKLLDGYTAQLDAYQASEKTQRSAYVVVRVNGKGTQTEELIEMNIRLRRSGQNCPDLHIIDATDKKSASKRTRDK